MHRTFKNASQNTKLRMALASFAAVSGAIAVSNRQQKVLSPLLVGAAILAAQASSVVGNAAVGRVVSSTRQEVRRIKGETAKLADQLSLSGLAPSTTASPAPSKPSTEQFVKPLEASTPISSADPKNRRPGREPKYTASSAELDDNFPKLPVDLDSEDSPVIVDDISLNYPVEPNTEVTYSWKALGDHRKEQSLFTFRFSDATGQPLMPPGNFPIHPEFGAYSYVAPKDKGVKLSKATFTVPARASNLIVEGKAWAGSGAKLIAKPALETTTTAASSSNAVVTDWLSETHLSDRILVIYTTASAFAADNHLLLRSNRMAVEMARKGWRVVYVPFSNPPASIHYDRILQVGADGLTSVLNQLLAKGKFAKAVYLCSSRSDVVSMAVLDRLKANDWQIVYETRDDMEEFQRVGYAKWFRPILEQRMADKSDLIIATAPRLRERISSISTQNDVRLVPNAAPDEFISNTETFRSVEHFNRFRGKPIVGYLGHLTASWFDWNLVIRGMELRPEYEFQIIGHGMPENVSLPPNALHLGAMPHSEAIEKMSSWRVGIIPFQISRLTFGVDPNKIYEYIAAGLMTVSAPMGMVDEYPFTWVYNNQEEFVQALDETVGIVPTAEQYAQIDEFIKSNSWSHRMSTFASIIEER